MPEIWTDPATGRHYDAATMAPLPVAGADLGEKPSLRSDEAPGFAPEAADTFADLLGIDPEQD